MKKFTDTLTDRHYSDYIFFLGLKRKVAQNVLKHALVLEFFKIK